MEYKALWVLTPKQIHDGVPRIIQNTPKSDALTLRYCTRDTLQDNIQGSTILVDGRAAVEILDTAGLEHVIVPWVGVPVELRTLVRERPHLTLYNSHYNASFVAQHSIALLLAATHHISRIDRSFRAGQKHDNLRNMQLAGKVVLLLGYGHIAKAIEPMLAGFGCKITRLRRQADEHSYGMAQRDQALSEADFIMMSLPYTTETKDFLDAPAFDVMKEGVVLVNIGRGETINQDALYSALQSIDGKPSKVAAAGLDVWWDYSEGDPKGYPRAYPFSNLENVVLSPHRAHEGHGEEEAYVKDVIQTIESIIEGNLRNRIELTRGY